jgi:hypothetical protein
MQRNNAILAGHRSAGIFCLRNATKGNAVEPLPGLVAHGRQAALTRPEPRPTQGYQAGSMACFPVQGAARQSPTALENCGSKMNNSLKLEYSP